jgi:hypothetical protein
MPACWDGKLGRKVAQGRFSQPESMPPQLPFDRNRRRPVSKATNSRRARKVQIVNLKLEPRVAVGISKSSQSSAATNGRPLSTTCSNDRTACAARRL